MVIKTALCHSPLNSQFFFLPVNIFYQIKLKFQILSFRDHGFLRCSLCSCLSVYSETNHPFIHRFPCKISILLLNYCFSFANIQAYVCNLQIGWLQWLAPLEPGWQKPIYFLQVCNLWSCMNFFVVLFAEYSPIYMWLHDYCPMLFENYSGQ